MRMYDLIIKKRDGGTHTKEEIEFIINGYTNGDIPDYQMSAWLMAVYYKGMTAEETVDLTLAMAHSGDMLDLSVIQGVKVDKHSTGGVGDKTTLIIAPILAALGVPTAKMSGRGLGHTGGTIDKLESIEGFNVALSQQQFFDNVNNLKIAVVSQTGNLAPADKKIYALRDVTATVDSLPLIASSIMSKKLAAGADVIVLDVKCGSGAFMKTLPEAKALARAMVDIGNMAGRKTYAVITDMNEPLGCKVGNALEVYEAIEVLQGKMPDKRLYEVSITLAAYMLMGAGKATNFEEAKAKCETVIADGSALAKMCEFAKAQGGNEEVIKNPELLPKAKYIVPVTFGKAGCITGCKNSEVGMVSLMLGGGRATKESEIDLAVGIDIVKHIGDHVEADETFAYIHANSEDVIESAKERLVNAYTISEAEESGYLPVIKEIIE